jgi:hypothetical protein
MRKTGRKTARGKGGGEKAKVKSGMRKLALAKLTLGWLDMRKMNASENKLSLTRVAPSTSELAKNQILIRKENLRSA